MAEFNKFFNADLKLDLDSYDFNKVDNNISEFQKVTKSIKGTVVVKGKNDLILSSSKLRKSTGGGYIRSKNLSQL